MNKVKALDEIMKEYQAELPERDEERNNQVLGKYGRAILTHLQDMDNSRYQELMNNNTLMPKVLERQAQATEMFRTIIEKQEAHEKVQEIQDFVEQVQARTRIRMEADSLVIREIILTEI